MRYVYIQATSGPHHSKLQNNINLWMAIHLFANELYYFLVYIDEKLHCFCNYYIMKYHYSTPWLQYIVQWKLKISAPSLNCFRMIYIFSYKDTFIRRSTWIFGKNMNKHLHSYKPLISLASFSVSSHRFNSEINSFRKYSTFRFDSIRKTCNRMEV